MKYYIAIQALMLFLKFLVFQDLSWVAVLFPTLLPLAFLGGTFVIILAFCFFDNQCSEYEEKHK